MDVAWVWLLGLILLLVDILTANDQKKIKDGRSSQTQMVATLLHPDRYSKQDPPMLDRPTRVALGIYIVSFYSISEQTMDYSISFYLRQNWRDPRLAYEPVDGYIKEIKLEDKTWQQIWIPDVFFRNEKQAMFHQVTTHNRMFRINATGYVWYVSKITATLSCQMKLERYPLDTQTCPIKFESFGYTMDTMFFAWLDDAFDIEKDLEFPQFQLIGHKKIDCSQNYTAGAFPCKQINFILKREVGYLLIQMYVPTMLIVILSWVAFWINLDAIPARVSLGLLTVLTMTTQSTGARSSLPRVSYIKAIDVWMSMCLVFVFASLLEFAVVNVVSRKEVRTIKPVRRPQNQLHRDMEIEAQMNIMENGMEGKEPPKVIDPEGKEKARRIDKISRKVFPLAFLVFNIVYWIMYTLPMNDASDDSKES